MKTSHVLAAAAVVLALLATGARGDEPAAGGVGDEIAQLTDIQGGRCLVGCNDAWVYALRADDGQRAWRFRAAPAERRIVAYGQVESAWPLVGGPAVTGGQAFVLAGRTTEADGGLYVHALEVATGRCLWSARRVKPDDGPIGAWNLRGVKDDYVGPADMLDYDGKSLAVAGHRTGRFDVATGQSTSAGSFNAHRVALMVSRYASDNQKVDNPPIVYSQAGAVIVRRTGEARKKQRTFIVQANPDGWKVELPPGSDVEALAAAGGTILAAVSLDGSQGGELRVLSGKDGAKLSTPALPAAPVFEGLAVARGRAYVALQNGAVACLAAKQTPRLALPNTTAHDGPSGVAWASRPWVARPSRPCFRAFPRAGRPWDTRARCPCHTGPAKVRCSAKRSTAVLRSAGRSHAPTGEMGTSLNVHHCAHPPRKARDAS